MTLNLWSCFTVLGLFLSCNQQNEYKVTRDATIQKTAYSPYNIIASSTTIIGRFPPPPGYKSITYDSASFAHYIQHLDLKPYGEKVKYYDGSIKEGKWIYCSVVDMEIDPQDLQQCADAVMRLRGEYLYKQRRFDEISFNFLSDGKPRYYLDYVKGDYSYEKFRQYMKYIFSFANTSSLSDQLASRTIEDMEVGDVFIQKGNPYGHAVIVVNIALDASGNKMYMLAQSYMPAQETQILVNPSEQELTPWYRLKDSVVVTPQWEFASTDLKHF